GGAQDLVEERRRAAPPGRPGSDATTFSTGNERLRFAVGMEWSEPGVAGEPEPQADSEPQVPEVVAAASALLGRPLTEPLELSVGRQGAVVLRCRDTSAGSAVAGSAGAGGTVVVKTYPRTAEGASCFAAEAAGLDVAGGSALAPAFLGADTDLHL